MYADVLMHAYGWTLEYVEALDAIKFLTQLRVIQKREADTHLMLGIISSLSQPSEEAWENFRKSLGYVEMMRQTSSEANMNDLEHLRKQMLSMG